ncbi:MAG: hypothetical protein IJU87_04680 [Lachnospiraceae bacterium]|nr:hypothetical protein [Lachnospiraceae bacterium]
MAYELEMIQKNGSKVHRDYRTYLTDRNRNGAMLEGLCDALENHVLEDKDIRMNVYSEAPMMHTSIVNGNIYTWEKNGFRKADGTPVMYADLWEPITRDIREKLRCRISAFTGIPYEIKARLDRMIKEPE